MKSQIIKMGGKEYTLQDISNKDKIFFQEISVGKSPLTKMYAYMLNNIIVKPQGLTIEDLDISELGALLLHTQDFLDCSPTKATEVVIEVIE